MQTRLFTSPINKGAELSDCGKYRYTLWRIWDESKPKAMIVGLNPSTADANINDRTIDRCISFMKREGFGGFYMLNLFAFRATDPKAMKAQVDPEGRYLNDMWLKHIAGKADRIIFAWGVDGPHRGRGKEVIEMFPYAYCFGLTKDGHPRHPLFLAFDTPLIRFAP